MRLGAATFALATVLWSVSAPAQEYPSRPVLFVGPYAPGGGTETQCTGDGAAFGSSGVQVTSSIPNTDPRNGAASHLTDTRTLYFGSPSMGAHTGPTRAGQVAAPLKIQAHGR